MNVVEKETVEEVIVWRVIRIAIGNELRFDDDVFRSQFTHGINPRRPLA